MSLCVGLTGGIGCGKSTVAKLFASHGALIIDTDEISHALTQRGGAAIDIIRKRFGDDYITTEGTLDRAKMRSLIFSDPNAKHFLEGILHPLILRHVQSLLLEHPSGPYTILVVPLLPVAPEFRKLTERVLVVDCSEEAQVTRVTRRDGMASSQVRNIISQQTARSERLKIADDVITNDGDLDQLADRVSELHQQYSALLNCH